MNTELTEENYEALTRYRQERAHETLAEIPYLRDQGYYNTATNRLYYACYYAAVALLTKHRISTNTHAGVKTMLAMHFVSRGSSPRKAGGPLPISLTAANEVTTTNLYIPRGRKWTNSIPRPSAS